ncbi:MAG: prepilin-type N-terminal cleavage/methylation domain-containing protein, partial [Planctomycetes bacterium]|nr:prepilin-type N-terminal cleavage/methylation domain-containing protein [Planctomycetota bacterium]
MRTYGFTLLEVLAVLLLTSLVIGVALNHYIDLNRASERALNSTRNIRKAAALLDRVSRDLEGTVLIQKPPEVDPLAHPWIFYGESLRETEGADHLKFMTRGRRPRDQAAKESDQEVVVYVLRHSEEDEDRFQLMRWTSPRLGD